MYKINLIVTNEVYLTVKYTMPNAVCSLHFCDGTEARHHEHEITLLCSDKFVFEINQWMIG